MANTIPSYLPVVITGDEERIIPGKKGVNAKVNIEMPEYKVIIFVPPVQKKVPSESDSADIFRGQKVTIVFRTTKDDRINASGRLSKSMIKKVGKDALISEFVNAAEKLWEFSNP